MTQSEKKAKMKAIKPLLFLCVAAFVATSCKKEVDMTVIEKTMFENADIRQIEVNDAWTVKVVADSNTFVEVKYSAFLEDNLKITTEGSKLHIGFTGSVYTPIGTAFQAIVHTNHLEQVEIDDVTNMQFSGEFTGQQLKLYLHNGSQCNGLVFSGEACEIEMEDASLLTGFQFVGNICKAHLEDASQFNGQIHSSEQLEIALESASRFVNKGGETATANVKLHESSILNMVETTAESMHVELKTASEATVHATGLLDGTLTDASTLYYKGHPQLQVDCDESSTVVPF